MRRACALAHPQCGPAAAVTVLYRRRCLRFTPPDDTTPSPSVLRIRNTHSGRSPYSPPPGSPASTFVTALAPTAASIPIRSIIAYAGPSPPCPTVLRAKCDCWRLERDAASREARGTCRAPVRRASLRPPRRPPGPPPRDSVREQFEARITCTAIHAKAVRGTMTAP
ncbi:hypothetical protein B0H14DRAFT_2676505 [Mycena olivaceomarginata]|nr:hypothetical protein B0H14DRAFT_2676505 [Mycena olivaceomarginata]